MILIEERQVTEAETEAAEAETARAEAERAYATNRVSRGAEEHLAEAESRARHTLARARLLRADYDQQQAALKARAQAETDALADCAEDIKELAQAWAKAVRSTRAIAKAQATALDDQAAYTDRQQALAEKLRRRGLGGEGAVHTGALLGGGLAVDGVRWLPVDGAAVLAELLASAVKVRVPQHPLGRAHLPVRGGAAAAAGNARLIEDVTGG